jgi:3',5'-cyclic AMP phosphodiesterase CpdA
MAARSWRVLQVASAVLALACAVPAQTNRTTTATPARTTEPVTATPAPGAPGTGAAGAGETAPPVAQNSVRFAVIGDTGTGERAQYETGAMLAKSHDVFPFEFVIMVGDNLYGSERPQDFVRKFELPYKTLHDAKIPFYAALGNHDDPNQRFYKLFNMNGDRYYTFKKQSVRFFALDSNYMDRDQLAFLEKELAASGSDWKIPYFHHPLYSSGGTHGSETDLRTQIEPLFLKYGVSVVFAGHEHFYERIKPQRGIAYFTVGGAAKLREGDIRKTAMSAIGFDSDTSYMLVEIAGDVMTFQTLSRVGKRIDGGTVTKVAAATSR